MPAGGVCRSSIATGIGSEVFGAAEESQSAEVEPSVSGVCEGDTVVQAQDDDA